MKSKKLLFLLFFQIICHGYIIGQFGEAITIIDGPEISSSTSFVADVDSDGDIDVISKYNNAAYWFENDGEGNFSPFQELIRFETTENRAASIIDMDGDGLVDFLMGRYWKKGLGNGLFESKQEVLSQFSYLSGDIDNDGLIDVIYTASSSVYWQKNLGGGVFESSKVLIDENLGLYRITDINFDGVTDIIVNKSDKLFSYINQLEDGFEPHLIIDIFPSKFVLKDFNTDGIMDLIAVFSNTIKWFELENMGAATLKQTISNYYGSGGISLGDLDYDGKEDLLVGYTTDPHGRSRYFHFNQEGSFDTTALSHSPYISNYNNCTIIDIDGDGHNDIFVAEHSISKASWLKNVAEGSFIVGNQIQRVFDKNTSISILDIDGDQDDDIWASNYSFENLGDGQLRSYYDFYTPLGYQYVKKDLDGDFLVDIAFPKGDSIYWKRNLGGGIYSESMNMNVFIAGCRAIGSHDFDFDGDIDLVAINYDDMPNEGLFLMKNDGLGNFTTEFTPGNVNEVSILSIEDVNQDGILDVATKNDYFANNGSAIFEAFNYYPELFEEP